MERTDLELREMARFFYALKDPVRLRILMALAQVGEMIVTELAQAVRVSQPLVSWHLGKLRSAELVGVKRRGRAAYYSIDLERIDRSYAQFRALLTDPCSSFAEG